MMRTLKPGTIVKMKESNAKWMLDHPDIYYVKGKLRKKDVSFYETETKIHMLCCMGEPIYGIILQCSLPDLGTYKILWAMGSLNTRYYCEYPSHFTVVRKAK